MSGTNFDVIDDEFTGGQVLGSTVIPIVDPDYTEWRMGAKRVPNGYVTARWRGADMVVVRVAAGCTEANDGSARCIAQRYTAVYVYGTGVSDGCNVGLVSRAYWPNWKDSVTPIFVRGTSLGRSMR